MSLLGHSRSASLAPSDSLSQVPSRISALSLPLISPFHQAASRPSEYPVEVLWLFEDCKHDPDVKASPGNESRPSMQAAIRNPDGTLIPDGAWDAIKLSSRQVALSLISIEVKSRDSAKSKTKQFYKSYYHTEWSEALTRLKQLQPLLQLCASHWKAEHVLANSLTSMERSDSKNGNKLGKRLAEDGQRPAAKKPRHDDITEKAVRHLHTQHRESESSDGTATGTSGAKPSLSLPRSSLGTAMFARPKELWQTPSVTSTAALLDDLVTVVATGVQPQLVDSSCSNLISKSFNILNLQVY